MSRGNDMAPFFPLWFFILFFVILDDDSSSKKPDPEPPPVVQGTAPIDSTLKVEAEDN